MKHKNPFGFDLPHLDGYTWIDPDTKKVVVLEYELSDEMVEHNKKKHKDVGMNIQTKMVASLSVAKTTTPSWDDM